MQTTYQYIVRSANRLPLGANASNDFHMYLPKPNVKTNKFMLIFRSIYIPGGANAYEGEFLEVQASFTADGGTSFDSGTGSAGSVIGIGILGSATAIYAMQKSNKTIIMEGGYTHHFKLIDSLTGALYVVSLGTPPAECVINFELIPMEDRNA